jgi:hypothetical protein
MIMSDVNISTTTTTTAGRRRLGGRWIDDWRPEDGAFWNTVGRAVARRNLIYSVFSELFAGLGGGNFASSMTNINAFYPARLKGWALGVNAGGGNLGVPAVQLVGLLVLATLGIQHPRAVVAIYLPLIILAAIGAVIKMDNLRVNSNSKGAIREVCRHSETWIMSLLYIGTFGSFIGFGFAFGQVLLVQFPEQFPLGLAGGGVVRVEWRGYSYPARSVLGGEDLVGVAFEADPRSVVVEVLQHETAYPDAGHLDVGHDVGRAYALNPAAPIEALALAEEIARLLGLGDGEAAHGRHGK